MEIRDEKGRLMKGHKGLKKKGCTNKMTREIKERIEFVLGLLDETLEEDINALSGKEKVQLWTILQEYIRPKMQRSMVDVTSNGGDLTKITFEVVNGRESEHKGK